jgi:hypothetical protein
MPSQKKSGPKEPASLKILILYLPPIVAKLKPTKAISI